MSSFDPFDWSVCPLCAQAVEDQAAAAAASAAQEYVARSGTAASWRPADAPPHPPAAAPANPDAAASEDSNAAAAKSSSDSAQTADSAAPAEGVGGEGRAGPGGAPPPDPHTDAAAGGGNSASAVATMAKNFSAGKGGAALGSATAAAAAPAAIGTAPSAGTSVQGGRGEAAEEEVADIDGGSWVPRGERTRDGRPRFNFGGLKRLAEVAPTPTVEGLEVMLGLRPAPAARPEVPALGDKSTASSSIPPADVSAEGEAAKPAGGSASG